MHKRNTTSTGFTIVELLIVVVVIAILAAISIVAYTNIQSRAYDSAVESDITAIIKKLEIVKVDLGHYPQSLSEFPPGFKFTVSAYSTEQNNLYYCLNRASDRYAIGLRSKSTNTLMGYVINTGVLSRNQTVTKASVCGAVGTTWISDATTTVVEGYDHSNGTGWNSTWSWTN